MPTWPSITVLSNVLWAIVVIFHQHHVRRTSIRQRSHRRDPVTGLLVRESWTVQAQQRLRRMTGPTVVFCDINGLKGVNDEYGHFTGDELLAAMARRLSEVYGGQGLIGRFAGDEFVLLLDVPTARNTTLAAATTLCTVTIHGRPIGAAFGVARPVDLDHRDTHRPPHDTSSATTGAAARHVPLARLLRAADLALLRAKRRCHTDGLSTAVAYYGPLDPAVPTHIDQAPTVRPRHDKPRT